MESNDMKLFNTLIGASEAKRQSQCYRKTQLEGNIERVITAIQSEIMNGLEYANFQIDTEVCDIIVEQLRSKGYDVESSMIDSRKSKIRVTWF